jgi:hypothetical protein
MILRSCRPKRPDSLQLSWQNPCLQHSAADCRRQPFCRRRQGGLCLFRPPFLCAYCLKSPPYRLRAHGRTSRLSSRRTCRLRRRIRRHRTIRNRRGADDAKASTKDCSTSPSRSPTSTGRPNTRDCCTTDPPSTRNPSTCRSRTSGCRPSTRDSSKGFSSCSSTFPASMTTSIPGNNLRDRANMQGNWLR